MTNVRWTDGQIAPPPSVPSYYLRSSLETPNYLNLMMGSHSSLSAPERRIERETVQTTATCNLYARHKVDHVVGSKINFAVGPLEYYQDGSTSCGPGGLVIDDDDGHHRTFSFVKQQQSLLGHPNSHTSTRESQEN